jgi:hypothetical protein
MRTVNYQKLMTLNPTEYSRIVNQREQEVVFYEHPLLGDEYPVIAVFPDLEVAVVTDFYDTEDMYEGSEYLPVYMHGEVRCAWEYDL